MDFIKRYKFGILAAIVVLVSYWLFYGKDSRKKQAAAQGVERFPYPTDRLAESNQEYILNDIQSGKIDLSLELVKLRRDCAGELDEAACNEKIRQMIRDLPAKDNHRLLELFEQYLQFESKMRASLPPNFDQLTNQEKYKLLKKARRDFGEDAAKLLFGMEEARIALQEEQGKFLSLEYANLPLGERLRLYEERKKEILGSYYQSSLEREPSDVKFGTEMMLQQADLEKLPEAERAKAVSDLRLKHFGPAQAARMDHEEKVQNAAMADSLAKMDRYLAAERDYLSKNRGISDEARRAGLENLRKSILGN